MLFKQVLALVAVSGLTATLVRKLSHHHAKRRVHHEKRQLRDDVHRWEQEGGNLPVQPRTR
ncbi:MAG: hypothetical protein JF607_26615 [Burkholderiales bacterium]|jgi:hypothetical protein|nr:hypothetical protein [Burkholderiales bacterium]